MKDKFNKVYANLPVGMRSEIICVLGNEPYTWNVVKIEVDTNTELSKRMLDYLNRLEFI